MAVPAIVTAGDGRAAKAVYGQSKVYLELEGLPLVARVVLTLQQVPEVSEVWVVGNAERLGEIFSAEDMQRRLGKPLHVVPQFRHLLENSWESFRRVLSGRVEEGRDPDPADADRPVLYLSGDLPFATPQEISEFVRRGLSLDCDYALGLATAESLAAFRPTRPGEPGIEVAYFNLREGRFRQNNLHLVRPARLRSRHYIEEMYELRHQRELGNMIALAWRIYRAEQVGIGVMVLYALMHLAGVADRRGWRRIADLLRRFVRLDRVEGIVGRLLGTRFRFVAVEPGGAAIDIDKEDEYDAARARFGEWSKAQTTQAAALYGPPALPAPGGGEAA